MGNIHASFYIIAISKNVRKFNFVVAIFTNCYHFFLVTATTISPPKASNASVAKFYGSLNISVPITARMSPKAKVLVYYVTEDGEIVSDEVTLKIQSCTANSVSITVVCLCSVVGGIVYRVGEKPSSLL